MALRDGWRKSSRSGNGHSVCVEVKLVADRESA